MERALRGPFEPTRRGPFLDGQGTPRGQRIPCWQHPLSDKRLSTPYLAAQGVDCGAQRAGTRNESVTSIGKSCPLRGERTQRQGPLTGQLIREIHEQLAHALLRPEDRALKEPKRRGPGRTSLLVRTTCMRLRPNRPISLGTRHRYESEPAEEEAAALQFTPYTSCLRNLLENQHTLDLTAVRHVQGEFAGSKAIQRESFRNSYKLRMVDLNRGMALRLYLQRHFLPVWTRRPRGEICRRDRDPRPASRLR